MKIYKLSAKLFGTSVALSASLLLSNCKKEEQFVPQTQQATATEDLKSSIPTLAAIAPTPSSTAYDLTKSLPSGYVKDGPRDYTTYVQAAINRYAEIKFPGFPILVNSAGLVVPSNRKLFFLTGSVIKLKPTSSSNYKIFLIKNRTNVTLVNPVVQGDRFSHLGTSGEFGMGIAIYGGSNISLFSPKISATWGDGIYVGAYSGAPAKTILIDKARLSKTGRNGITIASAYGMTVSDPYIEYSNRINPMAGIDIEPNGTTDELQNIKITNPVTYKNGWTGIQMGLSQFYYDDVNRTKTVSIEVTNHKDEGSALNGVWLSTAGNGSVNDMGTVVKGSVKFLNPIWKSNSQPIKAATLNEPNMTFTLQTPTVVNTSGSTLTSTQLKSLFSRNIGGVTKVITY